MRMPAAKILGLIVATAVALSAAPAMARHHHHHHPHHKKHPGQHGPGDNIKG
jgi:Spy/CpxP family protein refolding chaperone